jgi:Transposase
MEYYAGIDVSLEQSSVCVVDATGKVVREAKVASEPEALVIFFQQLGMPMTRIGLEAGPLSQWLHAGLSKAGFEVVLLETRQVKAALSAMIVKTDRPPRGPVRGDPGARTRAASPSCCGWAGSGRCTASRRRRRRSEPCWSDASSCRASSRMWS